VAVVFVVGEMVDRTQGDQQQRAPGWILPNGTRQVDPALIRHLKVHNGHVD